MRFKHRVVFGFAALVLALSSIPAEAQRRHGGYRGPVVVVPSPLLFGGYYHPYYMGYQQWYPYPGFGVPFGGGFYPGSPYASVRLQVSQRDAVVYVDGYVAGIVDDYDGTFQRLSLIPGQHEIAVHLPGYRTLRLNVYLSPQSTHHIRHTLIPLAPGEVADPEPVPRVVPPMFFPPMSGVGGTGAPGSEAARTGTLALRVQPGDASVSVDDEPWRGPSGQNRIVIELAEGTHRVRVDKPGFQSFAVDVDIRSGETTSFSVSLLP